MSDVELITRFLASLGIGLLLGLERERGADSKAGLRTFALVAMLGTLCALLAEKAAAPWLLPLAMAALAAMMISAYRQAGPNQDPGTTSTVALLLCFALGAATWYGYHQLAVTVALAATALLYFKAELHGVTRQLSRQDWVSLFQFVVVTFVVLPVLPNRGMGPLAALNPYRIWLMVVLISGLGFGGYVALRLAGERQALPLVAVLGALVSSTAATLAFSRHARRQPAALNVALAAVLLANAAVLVKLAVLTAMLAPALLPQLLPALLGGLLLGLPIPLLAWRRLERSAEVPAIQLANPSEMRVALGFGVLYAGALLGLAWLKQVAGEGGVYAMAVVSGLSDIDAITLSALQLVRDGSLGAASAARAILLAYLASMALKFGITCALGGWVFARRAAIGYLCVSAGLAVGFLATGG